MDRKREWASIYDDLLRYQVELSWDLEQMFFRASDAWVNAATVLDLGAGNAYYTSMLSQKFPRKHFICLASISTVPVIT